MTAALSARGRWHRAEFRVTNDRAGTRVELTLLNVASPAHWAGPITGWAVIAAVRAAL